ncbi:MAG: CdaR family protein [Candidatus Limnocylindria bacterium]
MNLRAPMGGMRLARWRRIDLRRLVTGDLPLKSAAIAVAMLLWVSAMRTLPPPEVVAPFDGRVAVERPEVPEGYVLRGQLGEVAVTLRGPEVALEGVESDQLRATVDLDAVIPGPEEQQVPVVVTAADERVAVVGVEPASVAIRLERRVARTLPVQARFANEPPAGFQAGTMTFRPPEVEIAGPETVVSAVTAVFATVRFGDAPVDLAQDVRPVPVDESGQPVQGLEIDPAGVQVSVPLISTATTRTVPVTPRLGGEVATGYWISRYSTEPLAVTVSGGRDAMEALDRIETALVDVGGITGSRTFTVPLVLPEGISTVGPSEATVRVTVVTLVGTRPFPLVAVQANGLGQGLTANVSPATITVILGGSVPTLANLDGGSVVAAVDVSGRGPGTYTLPVGVTAPGGTTLESVEPQLVTVTVSSPTASPAP